MDYDKGFRDGWLTALNYMQERAGELDREDAIYLTRAQVYGGETMQTPRMRSVRKKMNKPKQSPKQKLLTQMTKKKWDKYKKGKGKKTYVQIRAEVSRSQLFKKKAKRL